MTLHEPAGVALLPPIVFSQGLILLDVFSIHQQQQQNENQHHQQILSTTATTTQEDFFLRLIQNLEDKKKQISEQYLHLIEETVDHFLASPVVGVKTKALSDRYLDEPPQNMLELRRNADLLANCTQDAFNPHSELNNHLIAPLVHKVYSEFLDPLRQELNTFWMTKGKRKYDEETKQQQLQNNNTNTKNKKLCSKLYGIFQDIEHIDQMRELDSHSTAEIAEKFKSGGLSHVVPISGLALGRVHRMLNEHNTAIQHWGSRSAAAGSGQQSHNNNSATATSSSPGNFNNHRSSPPPAMRR